MAIIHAHPIRELIFQRTLIFVSKASDVNIFKNYDEKKIFKSTYDSLYKKSVLWDNLKNDDNLYIYNYLKDDVGNFFNKIVWEANGTVKTMLRYIGKQLSTYDIDKKLTSMSLKLVVSNFQRYITTVGVLFFIIFERMYELFFDSVLFKNNVIIIFSILFIFYAILTLINRKTKFLLRYNIFNKLSSISTIIVLAFVILLFSTIRLLDYTIEFNKWVFIIISFFVLIVTFIISFFKNRKLFYINILFFLVIIISNLLVSIACFPYYRYTVYSDMLFYFMLYLNFIYFVKNIVLFTKKIKSIIIKKNQTSNDISFR